jgi:transcriptional antiterminator NusG
MIQEVLVPTETSLKSKTASVGTVERKIYPGYVLIKMILTDDIWYIVRNTRGVTALSDRRARIPSR